MEEAEYIQVVNRVRISSALSDLRDVLPGFDGVVEEKEYYAIMKQLREWEKKLFDVRNKDESY